MKVVAYNIKRSEKGFLAKANVKKHDITIIANDLTTETATYAEGKQAVIIFSSGDITASLIDILAGYGIKYIAIRSHRKILIDKKTIIKHGIRVATIENYRALSPAEVFKPDIPFLMNESLKQIADQTINHLDKWAAESGN